MKWQEDEDEDVRSYWMGHILSRNCLLKQVIEGKINGEMEVARRRGRRRNWIGHLLRRKCLLKQVIEGKIKGEFEVARRRGRRRKKLLDGSHRTQKLPSKRSYRRKDKGRDRSGKKTRKKT